MSTQDKVFAGSVPKIYETYLVPLIFESYAADLVSRLKPRNPSRILEVAAGTGVVTRALASALPESTSIVATDLNQAMLDEAAAVGTKRRVEWRQADATQLPFPDQTFDAVVCQFGVMFFPDKAKAFAEAIRVLSVGGLFIFNVWDRIEENEFADTVTMALASVFPIRSPALPGSHPSWLSRSCDHRERSNHRRIHEAAAKIATVAAQSRADVSASAGHCLLPRDASAERDRSTQRERAQRGN